MSDTSDHPATFVWPTFRYRDARAALRLLVDAFGFEPDVVMPDDDDAAPVEHAQLRWPLGGAVMLGSAGEGREATGPSTTYVVCDDPDALHERAVAAGAEIVMSLTEQDYGSREFAARDAEGNTWAFGTYRG